jgi:Flp pilus assembly protein TadG
MTVRARHQSRRGARRRGRGQALVEFSIAAPIFFLVLFGIIDIGRYVYYVQVLNNAAREGARFAIVNGTNSLTPTGPPEDPAGAAVVGVVRTYAIGVIGRADASVLAITATWDPANNHRGSKVTVEVNYAFHSLIPIIPLPAIPVKGESTLVVNN